MRFYILLIVCFIFEQEISARKSNKNPNLRFNDQPRDVLVVGGNFTLNGKSSNIAMFDLLTGM